MTSTPVLAAPNFMITFILECDASGIGLGAILMQDKHPIALKSQKFKPSEQNKSTYDNVGNNACPC